MILPRSHNLKTAAAICSPVDKFYGYFNNYIEIHNLKRWLQKVTLSFIIKPKQIKGGYMSTAVKVSDELFEKAKIQSKVFKRSIAGQIEYWAKIGQMIEENPDLPLPFIQDILVGREQIKAGQGTPYVFGEGE